MTKPSWPHMGRNATRMNPQTEYHIMHIVFRMLKKIYLNIYVRYREILQYLGIELGKILHCIVSVLCSILQELPCKILKYLPTYCSMFMPRSCEILNNFYKTTQDNA